MRKKRDAVNRRKTGHLGAEQEKERQRRVDARKKKKKNLAFLAKRKKNPLKKNTLLLSR